MSSLRKAEHRIQGFLSHYPVLYAIIAGTGIILFWRGIWHTADWLYLFLYHYTNAALGAPDLNAIAWWDGPLSMIVGFIVLLFSGAFVSSFIGNEIILAGLRGEKQLSKKTETEVRTEVGAISEIKQELADVSKKIEELEAHLAEKK